MLNKRIPRRLWKKFTKTKLYNYIPDKWAVSIKFRNRFLRKLDLENPQTFSEKLQWLKLYNRRPEYTTMVDKYRAKNYVASVIGAEYVVPALGAWKSFDEIDFDALPEQFVLKCNHGSGDVVICKNKASFDREAARRKLTAALQEDYYLISREWPYKNVDRLILAEQYLEDAETGDARDYKFFCFDGKVKCFKVDIDHSHTNWYLRDSTFVPNRYAVDDYCPDGSVVIPDTLPLMMEFAEKLAKGHPFLRVDFYYINNKVFIGELTFFPGSGLLAFAGEEWDRIMGGWLQLPDHKIK